MCEGDLARTRRCAAADQCDARGRVMRRAVGALSPQAGVEASVDGCNGRDFQGFRWRECRQQAGQPRGEHRLARTGWPEHQQRMGAGGRNFQGALGQLLAADLVKVGDRRCRRRLAAGHKGFQLACMQGRA